MTRAASEATLHAPNDNPFPGCHAGLTPGDAAILPSSQFATLADLIRAAGREFARHEAFRSFGVSLRYRELLARAGDVASWLQQSGLAKGDRVALMMPNVLPYPVCLYGALLGGYMVTNINPLYTARELAFQLKDSGASALFVLEPFAHVAEQALAEVPVPHVVVVSSGDLLGIKGPLVNFVARHVKRAVKPWRIPGHARFSQVLRAGAARPPAPVAIDAGDIAFLQYTGGTTGVAKAAVILHRNAVAHTIQVTDLIAPTIGQTEDEWRVLTVLPMYHAAALTTQILAMPRGGGCCVLVANPRDLDGLISTMTRERFSIIGGVNTLYLALLGHPRIGTVDFSRCRLFAAGAMATQKTVSDRWQALTGRPLIEGYGLSEATGVVTFNPNDLAVFNGTVGTATSGTEISIRDGTGTALAAGEPGEICVRGPQVMAGYWNRPDETAKVMTVDGFLRTGDVGSIDAQGIPAPARPQEGSDSRLRIQRVSERGRSGAGLASGNPRSRRRRHRRPAFRRDGRGVHRPARWSARGSGGGGLLPGAPRRLQVPEANRIRTRTPQERRGQDPPARGARALGAAGKFRLAVGTPSRGGIAAPLTSIKYPRAQMPVWQDNNVPFAERKKP